MKTIYIANLPYSASEDDVKELFADHGTVLSVRLINCRETGRPRGFGFVRVEDDGFAAMVSALDGIEYGGRTLKVHEAHRDLSHDASDS